MWNNFCTMLRRTTTCPCTTRVEEPVSPNLLVAEENTRYNVFPMLSREWLPARFACSARRFASDFKSFPSPSSPPPSFPPARLRRASLMASAVSAPPDKRRLLPRCGMRVAPPAWCSAPPPGTRASADSKLTNHATPRMMRPPHNSGLRT